MPVFGIVRNVDFLSSGGRFRIRKAARAWDCAVPRQKLAAAFDACRPTLGNRAADKDYVRSQDREFILGFAQSYRAKFSDAALRKQSDSDHAPELWSRQNSVLELTLVFGLIEMTE